MSNAIRFDRSKITIRCGCEDNTFFVSVTDAGKGFTEKELLKADQPYYSGQASVAFKIETKPNDKNGEMVFVPGCRFVHFNIEKMP